MLDKIIDTCCKSLSMKLKLHQFLSRAGVATRKDDIYNVIGEGRISVGGHVIIAASYIFDPKKKTVTLDGKPIRLIKYSYYLINKPSGISCQKGEEPNIYDWFKKTAHINSDLANSLFAVGRLDKETEGLLLLTNDGALAHKLLQPVESVEKEYEAEVCGRISHDAIENLQSGVFIKVDEKKYKTRPAQIELIHASEERSDIKITITEGKKRQIRLMCKAVGHPVLHLVRVRLGKLTLDKLGKECFLEIDCNSIEEFFKNNLKVIHA